MNKTNKLVKPMNPLIWNTAAEMAATWFDAALSSGLPRGKYVGRGDKPIRMFVKDHIEKFVPLTISYFIEMLKPTSNVTDHMRDEIYHALIDPLNDPDLMESGKAKTQDQHQTMILNAIKNFDKNKINVPINSENVLINQATPKKDLKSSTALG